jgi:HD-like signal output (HDOD) protein/signal transduction histidine kinase
MTNSAQLFARLQDSRNLPSLPQVLLQVIALDEQEDLDIKKLVRIIAQDPAISAKALRLVNSAYFNMEGKFSSLERAVLYLGADTIKNIAITASVHQVFNGMKKSGSFSMDHFWWNSFACAIFSRRIAQQTKYLNIEEAYVAGLLHNLGKLLLLTNFPKEYNATLCSPSNQSDVCDKERQQIGVTHCEAGAWLIKHWKLNSFMADAVLYHHEPIARVKNSFPLVKITSLAHKLSKSDDKADPSMHAVGLELLGLNSEQMQAIISGAREEIENIATSLELSVQPPAIKEESATELPDKHSLHLVTKVQESSLLTSFLENLLRAKDQDAVLKVTERALNILLEIDTVVFFLQNCENHTLYGCASSQNRYKELVQDLVLSDKADTSLLARSVNEKKIINPHARTSSNELSLADLQLLDLMGKKGMAYIPMTAGNISMGVIVLGLKESKLQGDARLLRLMANQAAQSLYLHDIRKKQAQKIQEERLAATALAAAKIAHEVNNPLAIIKNYFKIFELKFTHSATLKEDLKFLNDEINRISTIIQQLNNFSPSGHQQQKEIDLNGLLADLTKILAKSILSTAKIQIHFTPASDLPPIIAPVDDIKQIFINLIKNSAEALHEGGNIYVDIHHNATSNKQITENKANLNTSQVKISVRDDGPGIPEAIASNLFDPFVSTKGPGNSGLGLSIVQNIVTQLHGTITCDSSKENGTTFTIELPFDCS